MEVNPEISPLRYQGLTAEQIAPRAVIRVVDLGGENTVGSEFPGPGFIS